MKRIYSSLVLLAVVVLLASVCGRSFADPLPGEVLKFQQLPLNNGINPTTGLPDGGAPYPGHDELSNAVQIFPNQYEGTFAADDFSDNYSSPVVHITWWGSYLNNSNITTNSSVQQFVISLESDVPAGAAGGFSQPGTPLLTQVVNAGALASGSGTFTEKLVNGNNGTDSLYQYNAELTAPFQEQAGVVYWLKIVALEGPNQGFTWGWHNRDWGIPDPLASLVPSPGEHIEGHVTTALIPVWHFQDDAVTGRVNTGFNPDGTVGIAETTQGPLNYESTPSGSVPIDGPAGPPGIQDYSEDLAFALYTNVPEPSTIALLGLGAVGLGYLTKKRIRRSAHFGAVRSNGAGCMCYC